MNQKITTPEGEEDKYLYFSRHNLIICSDGQLFTLWRGDILIVEGFADYPESDYYHYLVFPF